MGAGAVHTRKERKNKMNLIGPDMVNRCILSNVRESVDALIELAESESNSSALLALVKKTVKDEFYNAALKITEQINNVVKKYNNRECVIAGVSPEVKADRDENGCLDTGRTVWIDMHRIGIRRIGETASYSLTIDNEDVPGSGISDKIAIRLINAISTFNIERNDKRAAHE